MDAFLKEFHPLKIKLEAIKSATGNFDQSNVIGKGGFGEVYEGVLSHSKGQSIVAFKRLDRKYGQGETEFWKEILMLCRYTHENLISLLGFCDEDGEKILVYEHASHGSLDRHLSSTTLTWGHRLKICIGAATGLCHLHDPKDTRERVLHRDIKSSNILLDGNWNAKVSDMGLSKIGPANQQHTFLVSNAVGTFGYVDPMYSEMSILTKESDVYSFGVVLFEVLCGRLCFKYNNDHFQSLVPMWKQSYEEKKLDEIIFQELTQNMDLRSMETFSDIAYQCLQKSREERPKMFQVVEKLDMALRFQEISEEVEPLMDYEEMGKTAVPPLVFRTQQELKILLSKGILINGGKTWFLLNKNEEHCEMISAAECLIPIHSAMSTMFSSIFLKKSRFGVGLLRQRFYTGFKTHVRTQFLSPHIKYTINLVFRFQGSNKEYLGLKYILAGETKSSTSYFADKRKDGWWMAELYQFTSDRRNLDLEISFECQNPLAVEGIEFQPLDRVEDDLVFEDEEVDMQTISDSDNTYWEQKLPTDYKDIIKRSKDTLQWTTKKELYSILCLGFPINNGEEWFSLAKNGKKCHMLPARQGLLKEQWSWRSLSESRFEEVAYDPLRNIQIVFRSKMLSPKIKYACYLVYRLQENHSAFEPPVKVKDEMDHSWYIFLVSPQTPIIRRKVYQNSHNPLNRPKMKYLPEQRKDGWMEVKVWEFQNRTATEEISKKLRFKFSNNNLLKGLIVEGIKIKPI